MKTTITIAGCELTTAANPANLAALADVLLRAAQRALHQETTDGVIFEDADRFAISALIDGARDAIRGAIAAR